MLLLNAREVERLADMPRLVAAVEAGDAGEGRHLG